jgi:hypothetical protein
MHSSYLQRFFWKNAQFGTLLGMPELADYDIRTDVCLLPLLLLLSPLLTVPSRQSSPSVTLPPPTSSPSAPT